ncbi:MAG TPA: ricin-type beta-trefoil lectin domain protein, partial [Edaphobacter sp.]
MANSNPPQAGQWFYIQSNLTDSSGRTYVANVEAANASPGAQIILWPLQPNSYNTLWQFKNGTIVSALGSQDLVLDTSYAAPNTWVVLNSANGNSSQQWTFNEDGTITNQSNSQALDIEIGVAQTGAWLNVDAAAQSSASQQWSVVYPQVFVPTWSYIQSGLTTDQNSPLVATLEEGTSNVVLSRVQTSSSNSNQLWQITPDGRILSGTQGNPAMTLGPPLGGGQNGNYINVAAPSAPQIDPTTQWIFNDQSMFINASNGLALNVEGSSVNQNTPLIAYAVQSGPAENEVWSLNPAPTLADIMAAPPVPFITFTGDQGTAYTSICQQLGVPDLRSEYCVLDKDLNNYLDPLESGDLNCPQGVSPSDWQSVVAQLVKELDAANDIRLLFGDYGTFDGDRNTIQSTILSQLFSDAGMDQGSTTQKLGGTFLSVFEGVVYTGLEALPDGWPVLGNLMEAAINIGMSIANSGGGSISPNPFQVAYSDLAGALSTNFAAILTTMGNMETTILTDWGKMEATDNAISSTGPGSLAWPATENATLVNDSIPGYKISVMQMLLPEKYQIFQYQANDDSPVSGPPTDAGATTQWVQSIGNNTWNKYWIATPGNWNEYPSDEAMTDVWSAGVAESDFFQGLGGWGFARCYPFQVQPGSSPGLDCNGQVITITNQTPNPLTVNAFPNNGQGVTVNGPSSQTLQPYGSVSFTGYYTGEPGTGGGLA